MFSICGEIALIIGTTMSLTQLDLEFSLLLKTGGRESLSSLSISIYMSHKYLLIMGVVRMLS